MKTGHFIFKYQD